MSIDVAVSEDLSALAELLAWLPPQEADCTPGPERRAHGLRLLLETPELGTILVWREADRLLAMVTLLYLVSTPQGMRTALLEDMVVHPRSRDRGLGTLLLEAAVERCHRAGCARITLLAHKDNIGALRFYGRQGFRRSPAVPLGLTLTGLA